MKVARGRSWQPEIGMEHASRGRRSGNKGVGARWRGRFRIFSARHRSRAKVSHAENSGMTMLFFSLEVAPMSKGDSFTGSPALAPRSGLKPLKTKKPSCRHSVAACVSDHSRGQAPAPATALSPTATAPKPPSFRNFPARRQPSRKNAKVGGNMPFIGGIFV